MDGREGEMRGKKEGKKGGEKVMVRREGGM